MRTANTQTSQDIKALRAEVQRLGNIVKDMPEHAKNDVNNVIGFNRKELRKMAKNAGKQTRRFISEKQDQVVELRDNAEERITSHPFQAVGVAGAVGLVVGALLSLTRR